MHKRMTAIAGSCILVLLAPVQAGEALPFKLELGDPPHYASEAAARAKCSPDAVVWTDPDTGYFYYPANPEFGTKMPGGYACRGSALSAKYWDQNPFSDIRDKGRNFPINPDLLCPLCS